MEILRIRADRATVTETVSKIRDVLTSGMCPVEGPPSLSSSDDDEEEEDGTENDDGDNNDDGNDDDEISDACKHSSIITSDSKSALLIDNSVNLSGPVTDL